MNARLPDIQDELGIGGTGALGIALLGAPVGLLAELLALPVVLAPPLGEREASADECAAAAELGARHSSAPSR